MSYRTVYLTAAVALVVFGSGCAQIKIRPKSSPLTEFANGVTKHYLDCNYQTYEISQKILASEIAPSVLAQLKAQGSCAKSPAAAKAQAAAWKKQKLSSRLIIGSTEEGYAGPNGLVPVEVKGQLVQTSVKSNQTVPFDVTFNIGVNSKTKKLMVASLQFK